MEYVELKTMLICPQGVINCAPQGIETMDMRIDAHEIDEGWSSGVIISIDGRNLFTNHYSPFFW
jgi:hypothetical protein